MRFCLLAVLVLATSGCVFDPAADPTSRGIPKLIDPLSRKAVSARPAHDRERPARTTNSGLNPSQIDLLTRQRDAVFPPADSAPDPAAIHLRPTVQRPAELALPTQLFGNPADAPHSQPPEQNMATSQARLMLAQHETPSAQSADTSNTQTAGTPENQGPAQPSVALSARVSESSDRDQVQDQAQDERGASKSPVVQSAVESPSDQETGPVSTDNPAPAAATPRTEPRPDAQSANGGKNASAMTAEQRRESLRRLLQAYEEIPAAADEHDRLRQEVKRRLLYLIADRREDAVRPIDISDETEIEHWRALINGMAISLDVDAMPVKSRRNAIALRHFREANFHKSSHSSLTLSNLAFCTEVVGYGHVTEFKKNEFKPNQHVLLYVEVDNFSAAEQSRGWETELNGSYEVLDASGRRLAEQRLPVDRQFCRNRRRDYFIGYHVYLPKDLPPGSYTLQLTLEDVKGDKFGQSSVDFAISQ